LLEEESDNAIIIQLSTHTIKNVTPKTKQKKINLKHSPYSSDLEICLITKSNPSEIEDLIKKQNVPYIKKVNVYIQKRKL
jgi:ribosome biogenesis protein UTP30